MLSKSYIYYALTILFLSLFIGSCNKSSDNIPKGNAVYYWRTVLTLSDEEKSFLKENRIGTIYLHLFDVVRDDTDLRPHSTLIFKDTLPAGIEIVPAVFITNKSLNETTGASRLAERIISRADKMMTLNNYPLPKEIQFDFDWTASTREVYFKVLEDARRIMSGRGGKVSTTVRLHQLAETPPPADYGSLMVYNIGDFKDPAESNSILNMTELRKYLGYLKNYDFPLAVALPIYSWSLIFDPSGEFRAISNDLKPENDSEFFKLDSIHWRASRYRSLSLGGDGEMVGGRRYTGDVIRREKVDKRVLIDTKNEIDRALGNSSKRRVILYHLSDQCLKQYDHETFTEIFDNN